MPDGADQLAGEVEQYFKQYKVAEIIYSVNSGKGEVDAMKRFVQTKNTEGFDVLTYMHCKGVTKPGNKHIEEWTKLMHHFIINEMDVCQWAFRKGFVTYGINKSIPVQSDEGFRGSRFFYEGNFVSLNLRKVNLKESVAQHLEDSYYGLEGFWGKLCSYKEAYTPFCSGVNHYMATVPRKDYITAIGRWRYRFIKSFYIVKSRFRKSKA